MSTTYVDIYRTRIAEQKAGIAANARVADVILHAIRPKAACKRMCLVQILCSCV